MADDRKHIDQLFKDYLSGYKATAPAGGWERLQAGMQPNKNRKHLLFLRLAAASILLLLAFSAGFFLSEFKNTGNTPVISKTNENTLQTNPVKETENIAKQKSTAGNSTNLALEKPAAKQKTEVVNTESSQFAKNQVTENKVQPALQNQDVFSENTGSLENPTIPNEKTIAINDEVAGLTDNQNIQTTPENKITEPEKMSPEMLHQLLVGNDDAFAEDIIQKSNKQPSQQWSIGAQFSPVYSFRTLGGQSFSTPDEQVDQRYYNNSEDGIVAYAGGISLNYGFNDRLSLASGLYLSRIGQVNSDVVAYDNPDSPLLYELASSGGTVTINPQKFEKVMLREVDVIKDSVPGDYLVNGSFVQNFDYLEVPFVLKYKMLKSRLSVNLSGGLSPGILVNNRSYFNVDGEKVQTGYTQNIKPVIYNSVMGLGIEYSITTKLSINLDPLFKYSLSPINSNSGIKYHPYSVSWFTGITYKL